MWPHDNDSSGSSGSGRWPGQNRQCQASGSDRADDWQNMMRMNNDLLKMETRTGSGMPDI